MSLFRKYTFQGGIHPEEGKKLTAEKPIETAPIPRFLYFPLNQHIGVPAKEIVKPGDEVSAGQIIAEAGGFVSCPIHASAKGTVKKIEILNSANGRKTKTIIIETKEQEQTQEFTRNSLQLENIQSEEIIKKIQSAGIVGMGGAAFPTHVKLQPPSDKKIDFLLINGAECEPYLTCDYRIMMEETDRLIGGIELMMKTLKVKEAFIGIEKNKPKAIELLKEKTQNKSITVIPLEVKYPQGAEKQLIKAITKREVPSGGLPMDAGAVVQNIGTAAAVYDAVYFDKPLIERVLTVSGPGVTNPKNLLVKIGTPVAELISIVGGLTKDVKKIINGGPMMGLTIFDIQVPVMKGTSGILALTSKETKVYAEEPCISCGHCVDACPMKLLPTSITKNAKKENYEEAEYYGAMDCIECGSCAYVCPAKINLVQYIRLAKSEIIAKRKSVVNKKGA